VCQTDFSGYPDCRRSFVDALEVALTAALPSSCGPLRIATPLMWLTKAETVRLARRLPGCWDALAHTVTCYEGARPGCGVCAACVLRARGFAEAGEHDPAS
jgi:7-cyano-7-deazaguanine synthase